MTAAEGTSPPSAAASRWADSGGLRIHYLDSDPDAGASPGDVPIVFVPGFGEEAEEHRAFIEALQPRRVIVVDLRGRGRSDAPAAGYGVDEHAADLDAVVRALGLRRLHLVSYSRGTTYALRWATTHPEHVASYLIGDYPALQHIPPAWFPPKAETSKWRGRPVSERMPVPAIRALFAEAVSIEMWDDLRHLTGPLMVIRGGQPGAMLDEAWTQGFRDAVPSVRIETFEDSAHDLWLPDPTRFVRTVAGFIDQVEAGAR